MKHVALYGMVYKEKQSGKTNSYHTLRIIIMTSALDNDENTWVKRLLKMKSRQDTLKMDEIFLRNYTKLLDAVVRKRYDDMCYKCRGTEGEHFHICEEDTSCFVMAFGGGVLKHATDKEKQTTWKAFIDEVYEYGVFKRVVMKWLRSYTTPEERINDNREYYCDYMKRHFPSPTQEPKQIFLDFEDFDDTD